MEKEEYIDLLGMMLNGEKEKVLKWVDESIENKVSPEIIINLLTAQMTQLGIIWDSGKIFLPEVIMVVNIFQTAFDKLERLLSIKEEAGKIFVLGTVEGDVHNLGKDIVKMVLRIGGIKVIDLGVDVKADTFINALKDHQASILGLSALMTTTMTKQREIINRLIDSKLRDKVRVMVGGAPVTQKWAEEIGADCYAANAFEALRKAKLLIQ